MHNSQNLSTTSFRVMYDSVLIKQWKKEQASRQSVNQLYNKSTTNKWPNLFLLSTQCCELFMFGATFSWMDSPMMTFWPGRPWGPPRSMRSRPSLPSRSGLPSRPFWLRFLVMPSLCPPWQEFKNDIIANETCKKTNFCLKNQEIS